MLDLQAQPRTTSVTRGAPDQGDVGSDTPGTRGRPPRCAAAAATPAYPASLGPQKGQMAAPPRPPQTPGSPQDPSWGHGRHVWKKASSHTLGPLYLPGPPHPVKRGAASWGAPPPRGPQPTGRALCLHSWTKPPSAATASLSH